MENHDSRVAHSPEASTDERASSLNPQPGVDGGCFAAPDAPPDDTLTVPPDEAPEASQEATPPSPRPADSRFSSEAEERAYWAGVRIGMENAAAARNGDSHVPQPRDEGEAQAPVKTAASADPCPEPPPLFSDTLATLSAEAIQDAVENSFPPGGRKPRHDGFTPEKMGEFLRHLATTGVVEHAAAAVKVSAQAAYALRNRRQGRAFARMWDAILINRSRDRLAAELSSRAISGCVSIRKKDGEIVSEYHYYDNRLAMSVLTRLDRLAEKEASSEAHLRALSEDMEEFIDCLAIGEDADAFVERRRPPEPEPVPAPAPPASAPRAAPASPTVSGATEGAAPTFARADPDDLFPDLVHYARMNAVPDYVGIPPGEIPVADLDPEAREDWSPEQHIRFYRSGFAAWLMVAQEQDEIPGGLGATLQFDHSRMAAAAARAVYGSAERAGADEALETGDLWSTDVEDWTHEQRARAWRSGMLTALPADFWEVFARFEERGYEADDGAEADAEAADGEEE